MRAAGTGLGLGALVLAVGICGCGGDSGGGSAELPLVEEIAPAVEALESLLGEDQLYFEINASPLAVTLWVAADGATDVVTYTYADGELSQVQGATPAEGETFSGAEALTFDADQVLEKVHADLAESALTQFSVVGAAGEDVAFTVVVESARGGRLDVRVTGEGEVIELDATEPVVVTTG